MNTSRIVFARNPILSAWLQYRPKKHATLRGPRPKKNVKVRRTPRQQSEVELERMETGGYHILRKWLND